VFHCRRFNTIVTITPPITSSTPAPMNKPTASQSTSDGEAASPPMSSGAATSVVSAFDEPVKRRSTVVVCALSIGAALLSDTSLKVV
jgi:hypothetical protein